jgi:hypothetical protein
MRKLRLSERQYGGSVHGADPKFNFIMNRRYSVKTYFSVAILLMNSSYAIITTGSVIVVVTISGSFLCCEVQTALARSMPGVVL